MKYQIVSFLMAFLTFSSCSSSTKSSYKENIKTEKLDSLFNFLNANGMFNGSILVTKKDTLIYKNAFGYANEETKEKITPESVFYIASVSKQFTAMAIMILKDKGKLNYDDKIKDFFPDYPGYLENITVRQLLNHTSGLTDTKYYKLTDPSNEDVLEMLMKQDSLELKNGSTFRYSNSGYVLLAQVVQQVSKMPVDDFFEQEIFNPLEMTNTTAKKAIAQKAPKKVEGYNLFGENVGYKSSVIGPGGIYSTINDLEKWNSALNVHKLVSKETLMEAFKNGKLNEGSISINLSDQEYGYGFGWMLFTKNEKNHIRHDGTVESYRSLITKNLTDGYDYIYLTNHGGRLAMNEVMTSIDNILEKSAFTAPQIPIVNKVLKEFMENDLNIAKSNMNNVISNNRNDYNVNENSLNRLAYSYLRANQNKKAIAVFELNTALFPASSNAFDSLAEGYLSNEQYGLSKENYRKSLELNPDNANAREKMLEIEKREMEKN